MATTNETSTGDAHRITEVEHGLRVVTERVPGVRSVALGAWIGTGSRHEDDASRGYAHFLEHLCFKGNGRWDAEAIARHFDAIGADINAATACEYTTISTRVLEQHLPGALDVVAEMTLAPGLAEDDVDAEREVILEEIAMYDDSPSDVVHELASTLVFPEHSLGLPVVGTSASIAAATPAQLHDFHARRYVPRDIVISAAGAVDHDQLVDLVQGHLGRLAPVGGFRSEVDRHALVVAPDAHRPASLLRARDTEQVHVVLSGRGVSHSDERRYAAWILDTIFGNAPSSRLYMEVRERRGLAYLTYSFMSGYVDCGQVGLYVGVRPDRVAAVFEVLRDELERISTAPPSARELELAAGYLEGRMLLALESSSARSSRLGSALVHDLPLEPLDQVARRIRAVTVDDVHQLAAELLDPARLSLAVVGKDLDAARAAADAAGLLPPPSTTSEVS